jgi:hypothetical protein
VLRTKLIFGYLDPCCSLPRLYCLDLLLATWICYPKLLEILAVFLTVGRFLGWRSLSWLVLCWLATLFSSLGWLWLLALSTTAVVMACCWPCWLATTVAWMVAGCSSTLRSRSPPSLAANTCLAHLCSPRPPTASPLLV